MRQVGRRVRARDTLHAKLHPPFHISVAAAAIDAARAPRRCAVAAHNAPNLAADERRESRIPLGLAHLEVNVRVCASEGDGYDLASALRHEAPFARGSSVNTTVVVGTRKVGGGGGGLSYVSWLANLMQVYSCL